MIAPGESSQRRPTVKAHLSLVVLAKLGLFIVATVVLIAAIGRAQQLIGLVIIAGVLTATVGPMVKRLRVVCSVVPATLLVHALVFVTIVGMTTLVVQQIRVESANLETYATAQLSQLDEETAPIAFSRADLSRRASEATASWGTTAVLGDDEAAGIAMRASQLVVITVLSIFFTLQGDRIINAVVLKIDDRDRRRNVRQMWSEAVGAGATQLRRTLLHGVFTVLISSGVAIAFGLPGVALLAFWAACASAVPIVGPLVSWSPLIVVGALTLETRSLIGLIGTAIMAIMVLGRTRVRFAPRFAVGPLIITLGVATGLTAAGLPGAAAGLAIATGFAHAAANQRWTIDTLSPLEQNPDEKMTPLVVGSEGPSTAQKPETIDGVFVDLSAETLFRMAGLIVFAVMIQLSIARTGTILVWVVVGLLIAVGIDRPVTWVSQRTGARRSLIVITGGLVSLALLIGLAMASRGGVANMGSIDDDLPRFAAAIEDLPVVGEQLSALEIDQRIEDFQRRAPSMINRSPAAGQALRVVSGGVVAAFWILSTAVAALIDGPRVAGAISRRIPARYKRQVFRLAGAVRSALAGYVAGSALVAAINAVLVGLLAAVAGVPMPAVFAVCAFSWNFVPQIGAILGWAPVLLLALVVNPLVGIGCVAFFVVYQIVENNVIQPTIVGHAVDISALSALGAALAGAAVAGLVGAVLAIPVVGVVHAIRTELASDDFPRVRDRPTRSAPLAATSD